MTSYENDGCAYYAMNPAECYAACKLGVPCPPECTYASRLATNSAPPIISIKTHIPLATAAAASSGHKLDTGKPPLAQAVLTYFGDALEGVAQVSAYGARKYGVSYEEQNWRKVENGKGRYADALLRHLVAHLRGEGIDPESGLPHLWHVGWNALALEELQTERAE